MPLDEPVINAVSVFMFLLILQSEGARRFCIYLAIAERSDVNCLINALTKYRRGVFARVREFEGNCLSRHFQKKPGVVCAEVSP